MTQLTSDQIIKDLKEVIAKHETEIGCPYFGSIPVLQPAPIERWIPICSKYHEATYLSLHTEKGGTWIGKNDAVPVIAWIKVRIDPSKPMGITILEYSKLP